MRYLTVLVFILFSGFCFSQNNGSIQGIVLDGEINDEPLMYANVFIEGTTVASSSDENGLFYFQNLADGNYTLVYSFAGYETKKLNVKVASSQKTSVSVSLSARTISFTDSSSLIKSEKGKD
ncbi:carboxypeptidase-like protein [Flavobacteriaceae bacterium MAR_2010_72]|nr:carboxypeptidase-like protein [Flavobacteriaceae bacterium MAR_2010_72]TVZ58512.1 carboxypeptidase-like protein [Flavobacteriaceae bacterium MAR_2010_105]